MLTKTNALSLSVAAVLLAGCATQGAMTGSNAGDQAIQAGAIGATAGFLGCKLLGGSNTTCAALGAAGAALGAATGWKQGKEMDLAQARELEQQAATRKIPVQTESAVIQGKEKNGKVETVEAWKGTNVGLPPSMLSKRSPDLQKTVELSGQMAASRSEPTRILVSAAPADRPAIQSWLSTGIARGNKNATPDVRFVPMKKGDVPFMRIEPVNQAQFVAAQGTGGARS